MLDVALEPSPSPQNGHGTPLYRVGFALLPKKVARYLTPAIKQSALASGMDLCLIDYSRPLLDQGPFNAIIHKLKPNLEWEKDLLAYSMSHPEVRVIDNMECIRTLRNRGTMLTVLRGDDIVLKEPICGRRKFRVVAPPQVQISEDISLPEAEAMMAASGMTPPLVVKPVWTDGREGSHGLAVVHDMQSLSNLLAGEAGSSVKPPVVIQEFVEHGGVLFKVYVLGDHTAVSKRPSLGDNYLGSHGAERKGITQLPRISCKSVPSDLSSLHELVAGMDVAATTSPGKDEAAAGVSSPATAPPRARRPAVPAPNNKHGSTVQLGESSYREAAAALAAAANMPSPSGDLPPEWFTNCLAGELRRRLGMHLFNFDLLCPEEQAEGPGAEVLYYVIDINYFPGVDKIAMFEEKFVQFLYEACTVQMSAA